MASKSAVETFLLLRSKANWRKNLNKLEEAAGPVKIGKKKEGKNIG
jgi:hypothetical protein